MADKDSKDTAQQPEQQQEVKKLYPKSFRITDEVYKVFKDISKSFSNQDETLKQLCQCYELNSNSSNLAPSMQSDIKKFNDYVSGIQKLFISSLEYTNIVKDSEQEKYKIELDLKDKTIADLTNTLNTLKNNIESLDQQMKDLINENNKLKQDLLQQQDELNIAKSFLMGRIEDKDNLIDELESKNNKLELEIEDSKDIKLENTNLHKQLDERDKQIEELKLSHVKALNAAKEDYNNKYAELSQQVFKKLGMFDTESEKLDKLEQTTKPNRRNNTKRDNKS